MACEFSGTVRDAFRKLGHDAWSCDLRPDANGSPFHYQCDVLDLLISEQMVGMGIRHGTWDMLIAHPPCTHLSLSGNRWATDHWVKSKKRPGGRYWHDGTAPEPQL